MRLPAVKVPLKPYFEAEEVHALVALQRKRCEEELEALVDALGWSRLDAVAFLEHGKLPEVRR